MEYKIADLFNKGQDLFEMGEYDKSIHIFNTLRDHGVELKDVHYLLAQNYLHKYISLKKSNSQAYSNPLNRMQTVKEEQELLDTAFQNCKKSIELYSFQDRDSLFCIGEILRFKGDLKSSLLNYLRAKLLGDFESARRLEEVRAYEPSANAIINDLSITLNNHLGKVVI